MVPPQAKKEAEEIERMLREQQEAEAERKRLLQEERARQEAERKRKEEELAKYPLKAMYEDAAEMNDLVCKDAFVIP